MTAPGRTQQPARAGLREAGGAWAALPWRTIAITALLAAAVIGWAAVPLAGITLGKAMLFAAIVTGILSLGRLMVGGIDAGERYGSLPDRLADLLLVVLNGLPWAELMIISVVVLEALHRARPWHTGLLGVALLGYLLAMHLAETGARPGVLRPQLGLLAAGVGLMALAVGAAALPALPSGPTASVIKVVAVTAAVVAGGLTFPVWIGRRR
jgi:hypothetical protein